MPRHEELAPHRGKAPRLRGPGIHFVATNNLSGTESINELTALLKLVKKRTRGMKTKIWRPLGKRIENQVKQRFRTGGKADGDVGGAWAPLSEVTKMARREQARKGVKKDRGGSQPIKRQTLKLEQSTKYWEGRGKNIVRVGSFLNYAYWQEYGGPLWAAMEDTGEKLDEDAEGKYFYLTGRDDRGKRVRVRLHQDTAQIPARPAIYMNERMIQEAVDHVANFAISRFADEEINVDKIITPELNQKPTLEDLPF